MVHLPPGTEQIRDKKSWCDIQHLVMNRPIPHISTRGTHCDTPVESDKSWKPCHSSQAPSPGQSHHTVVAATVSLQTNCYLDMKTCSLPPRNLTFITYKWCVCVRACVRACACVRAFAWVASGVFSNTKCTYISISINFLSTLFLAPHQNTRVWTGCGYKNPIHSDVYSVASFPPVFKICICFSRQWWKDKSNGRMRNRTKTLSSCS